MSVPIWNNTTEILAMWVKKLFKASSKCNCHSFKIIKLRVKHNNTSNSLWTTGRTVCLDTCWNEHAEWMYKVVILPDIYCLTYLSFIHGHNFLAYIISLYLSLWVEVSFWQWRHAQLKKTTSLAFSSITKVSKTKLGYNEGREMLTLFPWSE